MISFTQVIPEGRLYSGSIEIFRRRRRQPEIGLKTQISPQWSTGSMSDFHYTQFIGSPRETDATLKYS